MSAKKPEPLAPPAQMALYDRLIATIPGLERKGATMPYTSLNGHMFSYLAGDGILALRLPQGPREKFLADYHASLRQAYGIIQKEYVAVPDGLLQNTPELKPYFELSYEYVKSLKPKPTTRKKPAG